jgi:SAM-dependent methyltransferase
MGCGRRRSLDPDDKHGDVTASYYRPDLALVHHLGFGFHADACAPGIIELLEPIRARNGLVVELGCGSGLLTKHLLAAGHRVLATDGSPAMVALAREVVGDGAEVQRLLLPEDPIPAADAIVSVGHVLNYLPDRSALERALVAAAQALCPGGVLALDLCDLEWGKVRRDAPNYGGIGDGWAIVTRFSTPSPDRFVRDITTFVRSDDATWRRDDEHHENILIDTRLVPELLSRHGVEASVEPSFGGEDLPPGLRAIVGRRRSQPPGP